MCCTHMFVFQFPLAFLNFFLAPGSNYDTYCMPKASEVLPDGRAQWDRLNIAMDTSDTKNLRFPEKVVQAGTANKKTEKWAFFEDL